MMMPASTSDIRAIEARLGAKGRRVFTVKGWNDALRQAGIAAGTWWLSNYGKLRWNPGYAQKLGYRPGRRKRGRMLKGGESPYYSSGQFLAGFNTRAKTVAVATKGRSRFHITIPGGFLNFHPEHVATFRKLPKAERVAVAREFRRSLIQAVQTGRAQAAARQQAKAQARLAKRQATAARRAAARTTRRNQATRTAA